MSLIYFCNEIYISLVSVKFMCVINMFDWILLFFLGSCKLGFCGLDCIS